MKNLTNLLGFLVALCITLVFVVFCIWLIVSMFKRF